MSASNFASVWFDPATHKQAMMFCVQTRGMWYRASSDRPLGDHRAFFEINDRNVAVTIYNVPHSDIQSFPGWLDGDACGIAAKKAATYKGSIDLNRFDDKDLKLYNIDFDKLKTSFETETIIFEDGTKVEAPESSD